MTEIDAELLAVLRRRVGQTVCGGRYSIDGILGVGGMAAVYSGVHRNGRRVAMKLLHPEFARRPDVTSRFLREGRAANTVDHPGVVAVIDDDVTEDGVAFLVMERLEGKTVEQLWEDVGRRMSVRAVLAIARELCEVLAVAHGAGIVHRDLKPENLFVTNAGQLKVLDFGLAQLRDAARPKETQTGMVFGTPAFMPPEQASGQPSQIDPRTDLWAVGATMFTLLSGELVHRGETAQHFVMLAAIEQARSLRAAMPDAHPQLVHLVDRALTREKERRWQSADAMREAIVAASEVLVGDPEPPMMTPMALEWGAARGLRSVRMQAADVTGVDTTLPGPVPAIPSIGDDTWSDPTRYGPPEVAALGSEPPTEPPPAPSSRTALDTRTDRSTPDELPTRVRAASDTIPPEGEPGRRGSWGNVRRAVESFDSDDDDDSLRGDSAYPHSTPDPDRLANPPLQYRASLGRVPIAVATPGGAFAAGNRPNGPLPIQDTHAAHPKASLRSSALSPRVRIAAAIVLGLLPLVFFLPRECGTAPAARTTASSTGPAHSAVAAPARTAGFIVAPDDSSELVEPRASGSPSARRPSAPDVGGSPARTGGSSGRAQ